MASPDCPYCSLARTQGQTFCSRHSTDMRSLSSGVFYIHEKEFEECDWHVTRLSINFNFDDSQTYVAGNREYKVSPHRYLLLNEGQSFKTEAANHTHARMVTIAFKVGLADEMYRTITTPEEKLLDGVSISGSTGFFEKTYDIDEFLNKSVLNLLDNHGSHSEEVLNDKLESILEHLLRVRSNAYREVLSIRKVKPSTRFEIYKRLHWAIDYIHSHYCQTITVDQLAMQACLSPFHFKRLFREFFHEAPYQYIRRLRIQHASELLLTGSPVHEVCKAVGWGDTSSFIRLFKQVYHTTPNQFRRRKE